MASARGKRARVTVSSAKSRKDAAQDFANKKKLQRRKALRQRALLVGGITLVVLASVQMWRWHNSGVLDEVASMPHNLWHEGLARSGLRVEQVYMHGRKHTTKEALEKAIGAVQGTSIFSIDLAELRKNIEAIPEVRSARVRRQLPDALHISLKEREPKVVWQHEGKQALMDAEGVVLDAAKYQGQRQLLVVVGADAPEYVPDLLAMLNTEPVLKREVLAAVRVGARRWNMKLQGDITVMLPEQDTRTAWSRFALLVKNRALLTQPLSAVDMRLSDRVFVTPKSQPDNPVVFTSSKRT